MILYRDDTEDSELRIAAYIQVMKCPNEYIISQVRDTLASEEVNQVNLTYFQSFFININDYLSFYIQPRKLRIQQIFVHICIYYNMGSIIFVSMKIQFFFKP